MVAENFEALLREADDTLAGSGNPVPANSETSIKERLQSAGDLDGVRGILLKQLWHGRDVSRVLKVLRFVHDKNLVDQLVRCALQGRSGLDGEREAWERDRSIWMSLVALSHLENQVASDYLSSLAPEGMLYVPPGAFLMGTEADSSGGASPQHCVWLAGFFLRRHTSTMSEYRQFMLEGGYEIEEYWTPAGWKWRCSASEIAIIRWNMLTMVPTQEHPVSWLNWYEAVAFARWAKTSLPTEAQWEKAARGMDGREYPWGNDFDASRCNTEIGGPGRPTKSGRFSPAGDSCYGMAEMSGNLLEWVSSLYMPYPYNASDGRENLEEAGRRIHRGGAWSNPPFVAATYFRTPNEPYETHIDHGVRLAVTLAEPVLTRLRS